MMHNQNSRILLLTALFFSFFINSQLVNADSIVKNKLNGSVSSSTLREEKKTIPAEIVSLKLISVDYFSAQLELTVDVDSILARGTVFINCKIPEITNGAVPYPTIDGENRIIVDISRSKSKNISYTSKKVEVVFYTGAETLFVQPVDLEINWPGPEYALQLIKETPVNPSDFSSVSKVNVNRNLLNFNEIVVSFLNAGLPIEKFEIFGSNYRYGHNLSLGEDVDIEIAKKISRLVLLASPAVKSVAIKNDDFHGTKSVVLIGGYDFLPPPMSESSLSKLKKADLSDKDFYSLLGYTPKSKSQKVQELYAEAYALIDTAQRENFEKAKTILDELIGIDPNFPRAYLELARYYMNVSKDRASGLSLAEKSILIAKDIDPNLADTRVLLGYVYTNQGRYSEADKEYLLAKKLGTDNLWLYANWGLNYQFQDKAKQAVDKYLKVIEKNRTMDRNDRPRLWVFGNSEFFNLLIETKQFQLADEMYQKYSEEYPEYTCILQGQAALRVYYLQKYTQAIESYLKSNKNGCRRNSETMAVAYYMKWKALKSSKSLDLDVVSALRQADALSPSDSQLFYKLATSDYTASVIPDIQEIGKNINAVDSNSMTPLLLAVSSGKKDVAERLLKNGADINQISGDQNYFALGFAVYTNNSDMVELLMKYKADPNVKFMDGLSLHDIAKEQGNDKIIKSLTIGDKI